jgi:hypothetical protein
MKGILPSGKATRSDREYVDEWRKFATPICEATDTVLYALDPGLCLHTKEGHPKSVELPNWFVHRLNASLAGATQALEACEGLVKAITTISHRRVEECPADLGEAECICGFHAAVDAARTAIVAARENNVTHKNFVKDAG